MGYIFVLLAAFVLSYLVTWAALSNAATIQGDPASGRPMVEQCHDFGLIVLDATHLIFLNNYANTLAKLVAKYPQVKTVYITNLIDFVLTPPLVRGEDAQKYIEENCLKSLRKV